MIHLDTQVMILVYSFLSGIIFGLGFDIYRILFSKSRSKIIAFIKGCVYFLIIGIIVFSFLLYTQYAVLSFYTYFYIFLGIVFYLKLISKFMYSKVNKFIESIAASFKYIFKYILYIFLRGIRKKNY